MSTKSKERTIVAEEKQLRKLTARRDKGNYKGYFFVLIFLICCRAHPTTRTFSSE